MNKISKVKLLVATACAFLVAVTGSLAQVETNRSQTATNAAPTTGFTDAAAYGFSPEASGLENAKALQRAVDQGGTITVSRPGTYAMANTVFVGSHTTLIFGNDVFLKKVREAGGFVQVLLNKGALTKTYDEDIVIRGLQIIVNDVESAKFHVYGLRGHLAFFYVKDLRIEHFRCLDVGKGQFALQVCAFENILINDVVIKGGKDGVHLGWGRRFKLSNGIFETGDDAVALNAQDYSSSNPEMGWIEDGVVENCRDLANTNQRSGFFCRIIAGGWIDWKPGMEVQQSDTVVSDGRMYRVQANADGVVYKSLTRPAFTNTQMVLDGIKWGMTQEHVTYTAGVRNVVFRDIFLEKPRAFSMPFAVGKFNRSYYPGAQLPVQQGLVFDNVRVLYDEKVPFLLIGTPVDVITLVNCSLRNNRLNFSGNDAVPDYLKTRVNLIGCIFNSPGKMDLLVNNITNKVISLKTTASVEIADDFSAGITSKGGTITVDSDLTGLKK